MVSLSYISRIFLNWPIRRKLTFVVLATSGFLIALIASMLTVERYASFRSNILEDTTALAAIIGTNSSAALAFDDPETGREILGALRAEKDVILACLFSPEGATFASYVSVGHTNIFKNQETACSFDDFIELGKTEKGSRFGNRALDLVKPVYLDQEIRGYVAIRTDLHSFKRRLTLFVACMFSVGMLLFIIAHFVFERLNNTIVGPIVRLAHAMEHVSLDQDYTRRVTKTNSDEVGVLMDGFNDMLAQIQKRDRQIAEHQLHLEELVQKRTEELESSNKQLVLEIEERKTAENQLAHAQKMKAIGTLAGGVAHDLNNILSGVVSYPELLLLDLPDESPLRKPLETICTSGKKATAIVQDLLTLARRGVQVEEPVDLQKLVAEYIASPECDQLRAHHPGVAIELLEQRIVPMVTGSPFHLSKTVMNLVSNAAEAILDEGRIVISLDRVVVTEQPVGVSHHRWRKGEFVVLTVNDNGIGIPKKYQNRIFEPFYSKKEMGRSGTGLGMAVVWGTIEDHNGFIALESEENVGTTFRIYLPGSDAPVEEGGAVTQDEPVYGKGQTILVVDDSERQREIATAIFRRLGYETRSVASGEIAVEYLKHHEIDLIVLDMIMPSGIDGLETYKQIMSFKPGQKAIITSGFSESIKVKAARELGVREYLKKPYSMAQISKIIQRII